MIKRCFAALLLAMLFTFILPLYTNADLIVEPRNDFLEQQIGPSDNEIVFLPRAFYANGRNGFVSVMIEPDSRREIASVENGKVSQIYYTYNHNGRIWGVYDVEVPGKPYHEWLRGWVLMDDLLAVYDSISFEEEYWDELYTYTGSIDTLFEAQEVVFWEWPGSGIVTKVWGESILTNPEVVFWARMHEYPAYLDADGREWIAFPSKQWICLSDPSNRDIPVSNPAPEPVLRQPGDGHSGLPGGLTLPVLIIILVAALAIVTAVLIRIFWKKNKSETKDTE